MTPKARANHLIEETSPYLLQHAYNPVDWYPWGDKALSLARKEDRPILLSIGLFRLPLVSCDGARVLRKSGDRSYHERELHQCQS